MLEIVRLVTLLAFFLAKALLLFLILSSSWEDIIYAGNLV